MANPQPVLLTGTEFGSKHGMHGNVHGEHNCTELRFFQHKSAQNSLKLHLIARNLSFLKIFSLISKFLMNN